MNIYDSIQNYLAARYVDDPPTTHRARKRALRLFEVFCKSVRFSEFEQLSAGALRGFISWRVEQGDAPASVKQRLGLVRAYCKWASDEIGAPDFAKEVRLRRVQPSGRERMKDTALDAMRYAVKKLKSNTHDNMRNAAMLELFLSDGLRPAEVSNLLISQLDTQKGLLKSVRRKGGKIETIAIADRTLHAICAYLPHRINFLISEHMDWQHMPVEVRMGYPLFISRDARSWKLCTSTIARTMTQLGASPRLLRREFANRLYDSCKNIKVTSKALGHAQTSTTEWNYLSTENDEIKKAKGDIWN